MAEVSLVIAYNLPPTAEDISCNYINTGAAALRVFQTFEVSGDDEQFKLANQDRTSQKELFLEGETHNPTLSNCPNYVLEASKRAGQNARLREVQFMHQLRQADIIEPTLEDQMAGEMIGQRLNELGFIDAAATIALDTLQSEAEPHVAKYLKDVGRELYGMPDKPQALSDIKRLLVKSADYANQPDHPLKVISQELNEMVAVDSTVSTEKPETLSKADIEHFYELLKAECQPALDYAFEGYDDKDMFTVQEIQIIFTRYSKYKGYNEGGLKIIIVPNKTLCAAKHDPYVIEIGSERPVERRTRQEVTQTLIHEVEVHAGRIFRGLQLGSGLAGFGLKRHEIFEEALAKTMDSIIYKTAAPSGEMQTMAIALAAGYDSGQDRDFRDCFEALWRLQMVKTYKQEKDLESQVTTARTKAYDLLVRIWRGMPTDVAGCIYAKDAAYRNTSNVLPYLRGTDGPLPKADFLRLFQAKYDPTNPEQDAYIRQLTS